MLFYCCRAENERQRATELSPFYFKYFQPIFAFVKNLGSSQGIELFQIFQFPIQILGIFEFRCTISKYEVRSEKIKKVDENRDPSYRGNQDVREEEPEQATRHDLARITLLLHADNTSRSSICRRSRFTYDRAIPVVRGVRRVLYDCQPCHLFAGA